MKIETLWKQLFGNKSEAFDYAGRPMVFSDIGKNKGTAPTIDHLRPLALGGTDEPSNLIICSLLTNREKADSFPTWNANGKTFQVKRVKGTHGKYEIWANK
jgi:hypothetical protein